MWGEKIDQILHFFNSFLTRDYIVILLLGMCEITKKILWKVYFENGLKVKSQYKMYQIRYGILC